MPEAVTTQKSNWYWLRWFPRVWMLIFALLCIWVYCFDGFWVRSPFSPASFIDQIFLSILFCLFVAWYIPLLGGLVCILSLYLLSSIFYFESEYLIYLFASIIIFFPSGIFYFLIGIDLALKKRLLKYPYSGVAAIHIQIKLAAIGWRRIIQISRIWLLVAGYGCLLIYVFHYKLTMQYSFFFPDDLLFEYPYLISSIAIEACLGLTWFKPKLGGWCIILLSLLLYSRAFIHTELIDILLPCFLIPTGIVFLKYGIELDRQRHAEKEELPG